MSEKDRIGSRRLISRRELLLALAVIVLCAGVFFYRQHSAGDGATARVYLDAKLIREIALEVSDDYRINLLEDYGVPVSFQVKDGAIRYVDVTCPDHICEKTGYVSLDGQTAVCMPNRVAVHIVGGS